MAACQPADLPAEHAFPVWMELQGKVKGRKFLDLIGKLFAFAEVFL